MTVINFMGYSVRKMLLDQEKIDNGDPQRVKTRQKISTKYDVQGNKANIELKFQVESGSPINIEIVLVGHFSFKPEEDKDKKGFEFYLKSNAVAILFPYLRQTLTALTALSNTIQPVILPTVNIAKMLKKEERNKK